ncbi:MAG TPA: cytochrome P450, partial [Mycobacterium sp.]
MSVASVAGCPTIYEADLPTVSYEDASTPQIAHERLKQARQQGAVAMGAHGPEILSYELAHTALRDHRLAPPPGLGLEAQ